MSRHADPPSPFAARVKALESILLEKGLVDPQSLDLLIDTYENKVGPRNGARVVARAWSDPAYKARLFADGNAAAAELGFEITNTKLVAVENTKDEHNVVVCTLCSCYPRDLLGLPPSWYKSRAYRARVVREPRAVLEEFGTTIPDDVKLRVHDSTADMRFLVVPRRPEGTQGMSEDALAALVTRDSMIGVATIDPPKH